MDQFFTKLVNSVFCGTVRWARELTQVKKAKSKEEVEKGER